MQAQRLAQTRPGAAGAVLCESCVPVTGEWAFGPWPEGVPVQIHGMDADPFFAGEGDIDAARELVSLVPDAELFVYPGERAPVRGLVAAAVRLGRGKPADHPCHGVPRTRLRPADLAQRKDCPSPR